MRDQILNESVLEESAPMTADEMVSHVLQDVVLDNSPDDLADEFINEFVLQDRPETTQILSLLETPSETLVGVLKGICGQSYQAQLDALDLRGVSFLEKLKNEIGEKMTTLAADTAPNP